MPIRLEDAQETFEAGMEEAGELGEEAKKKANRFWNGFSDFAIQDNVLEVAVGLMFVYYSMLTHLARC